MSPWREGSPRLLSEFCFEQFGTPHSSRTYYTRHQVSRVQCHFELDTLRGQRFLAAILAGQLTSSTEPGGFALLPRDALVDSWFRGIPVPRTWRVYLATGFDFREKNRRCFGTPGDEGNICPPGGRGVPDCSVTFVLSNLGLPSLQNL